jgi:ribosomal protein S18 acetylase RimI-like enzyme
MIQIRKFQETDTNQLRELIIQSALYQKKELEKEEIDSSKVKEQQINFFERNIKNLDWQYMVAEDGEKVVGYITLEVSSAYVGRGFVGDLFIISEYRGKGISKDLLKAGLKWLQEKGVHTVSLAVHKSNDAAVALYTGLGFVDEPESYRYLEKKL